MLLFINRDAIAERFASRAGAQVSGSEPYTFESGSMQVCASVGNGMALVSTNSLQLLDSAGNTAARQVFSMKPPAVTTSDKKAAAFDVGGTEVCIADLEGGVSELNTQTP